MNVLNCTNNHIERFALDLFAIVKLEADDVCCVLAVANGGIQLGKAVKEMFDSKYSGIEYAEIVCCRPSSGLKKKHVINAIIRSVFKRMPSSILNVLRVVEHHWLSRRTSGSTEREYRLNSVLPENVQKIIIVDDAIDSGHSMLCVYDMIRHVYPCSDIYTAVFTTTQKQPVFTADFSAYSDTLVRFPWSLDGKYD